jgi:hypothetical protein
MSHVEQETRFDDKLVNRHTESMKKKNYKQEDNGQSEKLCTRALSADDLKSGRGKTQLNSRIIY